MEDGVWNPQRYNGACHNQKHFLTLWVMRYYNFHTDSTVSIHLPCAFSKCKWQALKIFRVRR